MTETSRTVITTTTIVIDETDLLSFLEMAGGERPPRTVKVVFGHNSSGHLFLRAEWETTEKERVRGGPEVKDA